MKNSRYLSKRIVAESLNNLGMGHLDESILSKISSAARVLLSKVQKMTNETAIARYLNHRYSPEGKEEAKFLEKAARIISKLNNNEVNDPEVREILANAKNKYQKDSIIADLEKEYFKLSGPAFAKKSAAVDECLNVIAALISTTLGTIGLVGNLMMGEESSEQ
jgi:hypothetical protein